MTKKIQNYEIKIPAKTENLETIRNFIISATKSLGFHEDEMNKILLAVDEACSNVIRHAYHFKENLMKVNLRIEAKKLTVTIIDHGKSFNPNKVKTPEMDKYLKSYKVGGLGMLLMKKLMDEVEYDIKPNSQNKVKLIKYIK